MVEGIGGVGVSAVRRFLFVGNARLWFKASNALRPEDVLIWPTEWTGW